MAVHWLPKIAVQSEGPPDLGRMNSSYFDIQDILAEEQRIKVQFLCHVSWSDMASGTAAEGETIEKYSIMELPLWMASALVKTPFAEKITPRAFSSKIRSDLNANVRNVQLKDVSPHFYALGMKLFSEFSDQRLSDLLYITFMGRIPLLMRPLQCTADISGISPLEAQTLESLGICPPSKLDAFEYYVFQLTNASRHQYDAWLRRDILQIRPLAG